jgi:hypothetical protein
MGNTRNLHEHFEALLFAKRKPERRRGIVYNLSMPTKNLIHLGLQAVAFFGTVVRLFKVRLSR